MPESPESLFRAEKERSRSERGSLHAQLMAEAKAAFDKLMAEGQAARKSGRPRKNPLPPLRAAAPVKPVLAKTGSLKSTAGLSTPAKSGAPKAAKKASGSTKQAASKSHKSAARPAAKKSASRGAAHKSAATKHASGKSAKKTTTSGAHGRKPGGSKKRS